jgi:adenine-specific DNA-methyltransferase
MKPNGETMELSYAKKRSVREILEGTEPADLEPVTGAAGDSKNWLIQGDNLRVMRSLLDSHDLAGKVDLVYIDPPFATNTVFRKNHRRTATISASRDDPIAYTDILQGEAFLEFLRERLVFLRELMADHASLYLHIDYKIGHYVKVLLDEIFGPENFRNDISRVKCNPKNFSRKGYGNIKDMILFYTKSDSFVWNEPRESMAKEELDRLFPKIDEQGRRYTTTPLHAPGETQNGNTGKAWRGKKPPRGRHWRYAPAVLEELDWQGLIEWSGMGNPRKIIYADDAQRKGKLIQDIWEFKDPQYPQYPTEKNLDLLKRLIQASSNPSDRVLDCFCGSGTTLLAAQELGRFWIGIDESPSAVETTRHRLDEAEGSLFSEKGEYACLRERLVPESLTTP